MQRMVQGQFTFPGHRCLNWLLLLVYISCSLPQLSPIYNPPFCDAVKPINQPITYQLKVKTKPTFPTTIIIVYTVSYLDSFCEKNISCNSIGKAMFCYLILNCYIVVSLLNVSRQKRPWLLQCVTFLQLLSHTDPNSFIKL